MAKFICENCGNIGDPDDGCGELNGEVICIDCELRFEEIREEEIA